MFESTPGAHLSYIDERNKRLDSYKDDREFIEISTRWRQMALARKYMNNFSWLGRPIIQFPTDMMAIQEIIYHVKPKYIIETGVAHGGSLIFNASMQNLAGIQEPLVIGIDIDIRDHNRAAIRESCFSSCIRLIEGSSIDLDTIKQVRDVIDFNKSTLVILDSDHTHDHVLRELELYGPLVSSGSYLIVLDTHIEEMPESYEWQDRDWGIGNNPLTAVKEWLTGNKDFIIDDEITTKLMVTSAPSGFLLRK